MNKQKISKIAYYVGLLLLGILPFYRAVFGVDFTDTGYSIVNFINFADKRAYWSLSTYLSNFVGFVFAKLPFGNTLVGIRCYCTLIVSALLVFLFIKLSKYFHSLPVFLGLIISLFMSWCPFVVLYNYLSYLVTAVVVVLLFEGISIRNENSGNESGKAGTSSKKWMVKFLVAGILVAANVFVRFSNLTVAILILPVVVTIIHNYKTSSKEGKKQEKAVKYAGNQKEGYESNEKNEQEEMHENAHEDISDEDNRCNVFVVDEKLKNGVWKRVISVVGLCVAGFVLGAAVLFLITGITHGFDAMGKMFKSLSTLSNAEYGYSFSDMLLTLPLAIANYAKWVLLIAGIFLLALLIQYFSKAVTLKARKINFTLINAAVALVPAVFLLLVLKKMSYWSVFTVHDYTAYLSVEVFSFLAVLGAIVVAIVSLARTLKSCKGTKNLKASADKEVTQTDVSQTKALQTDGSAEADARNANTQNIYFALAVLCLAFVIPLGTNTGMMAYQNFLFVILPVALGLLWKMLFGEAEDEESICNSSFEVLIEACKGKISVVALVVILLGVALLQSGLFYANFCYASAGNRELTGIFESGVLKGTRTLPGMVGIVDELVDAVNKENDVYEIEKSEQNPNQYGMAGSSSETSDEKLDSSLGKAQKRIITWGDIPLMSFALDMPTSFSTGWPDLASFSLETFEGELDSFVATGERPMILINKWFSGGNPLDSEVWKYSEKAELLAQFMTENGYECTFENDKFRLYIVK